MTTKNNPGRPNRWWDWPAVFLLVIILTATFTRLMATSWTDGLKITRLVAYLGLIAGLALGYSWFSSRRVVFFAIVYGLFVIPWQLGSLSGRGILWTERLQSLGGRLNTIIGQLTKQQAVSDNLLFLTLMALLFWVLSIYAGYSLTRHGNPWRVILPIGIVLVIIHSYDALLTSRLWYLVIFLFFSLMLIARMVYLLQRYQWKESNTYIPPYLGVDFIRFTIVVITVLLLLSWTAPGLAETLPVAQDAWQRVKQPWNDVRNTFDNAFASLRSTVGIVTDYYGPNLSLGRGNRMSDAHILSVLTPADPPDGTRYYWRARVYDSYDNGWRSTFLTNEILDPDNFNLTFPDTTDDAPDPYTFSFTIGNPVATLLTANQPVWVSRPVKVEFTNNPDGTVDVGLIRATPPLRAGETYTVRSSLNQVTIADLRNAGSDYPDWVTERYLQIPDSITPRTIELALQIAEGKETPYDIATAVTQYLRTNIEYSETVPPLPTDQELVDWFLFDLKQGFCNYYATSEVIMLRVLGIPARLGVGYAQGEQIENIPDAFVVRQRDAHAWPEVYFPGIGWVEFEPTVSQPMLIRPLGEMIGGDANSQRDNNINDLASNLEQDLKRLGGEEEEAGNIGQPIGITTIGVFAIVAGLVIAMIILSIPFLRRRRIYEKLPQLPVFLEKGFLRIGLKPPAFLRRWAHYGRLSPLSRAYTEINLALIRLGNHPSPTETPAERASTLSYVLPVAIQPIEHLLSEYQTATYSQNYTADIETARSDGVKIRNLSYEEFLRRIWDRISNRLEGRNRTHR